MPNGCTFAKTWPSQPVNRGNKTSRARTRKQRLRLANAATERGRVKNVDNARGQMRRVATMGIGNERGGALENLEGRSRRSMEAGVVVRAWVRCG